MLRARLLDCVTDLLRRSEHNGRAIALHAGADHDGLARSRAELARVRLEAKVELPDFLYLAVRGLYSVSVAAVLDGAHLSRRRRVLQVGLVARHAHHAAAPFRRRRRS